MSIDEGRFALVYLRPGIPISKNSANCFCRQIVPGFRLLEPYDLYVMRVASSYSRERDGGKKDAVTEQAVVQFARLLGMSHRKKSIDMCVLSILRGPRGEISSVKRISFNGHDK